MGVTDKNNIIRLVPKGPGDNERREIMLELCGNVAARVDGGEFCELMVVALHPDGGSVWFHAGSSDRLRTIGALEALKLKMATEE